MGGCGDFGGVTGRGGFGGVGGCGGIGGVTGCGGCGGVGGCGGLGGDGPVSFSSSEHFLSGGQLAGTDPGSGEIKL